MLDGCWQMPAYVFAGEVVYPPGGTCGPRIQQDYQLVLLHTGSLSITLDKQNHHFEAGVVLLLTPGYEEFFQFARDSVTYHSWISIHCLELPPTWSDLINHAPKAIPLSSRMSTLAEEAIYWSRRTHGDQLLSMIGYHALGLFLQEAKEATHAQVNKHEAVQLTERYIHANYGDDICLETLGKKASVSAEYLCRLFQAECGTSPMAYLWHFRTLRAMDLLNATGLPISDIAIRCGFKTQFHLHRKVKTLTGFSPTQYRRRSWIG